MLISSLKPLRAPRVQNSAQKSLGRPSVRARVATTESAGVAIDEAQAWSDFSRAVSGEWEGSICSFTGAGVALELPPLYVPQAFREWGITLYDWQVQTSSIVKEGSSLRVSLKKLMPTVGCEADAVAFNEEASDVFSGDFPRIFTANGSFTRAAAAIKQGAEEVKVEHVICEGAAETRKRTRVVQVLSGADLSTLRSMEMGEEEWSEPYNGGRELFACGGGSKKISQAKRTEATQLEGSWRTAEGVKFEAASSSLQASSSPLSVLPASGLAATPGLVLMPSGVWSVVRRGSGGDVEAEVGWLVDENRRRVSRVVYGTDGKLKSAVLGVEERA